MSNRSGAGSRSTLLMPGRAPDPREAGALLGAFEDLDEALGEHERASGLPQAPSPEASPWARPSSPPPRPSSPPRRSLFPRPSQAPPPAEPRPWDRRPSFAPPVRASAAPRPLLGADIEPDTLRPTISWAPPPAPQRAKRAGAGHSGARWALAFAASAGALLFALGALVLRPYLGRLEGESTLSRRAASPRFAPANLVADAPALARVVPPDFHPTPRADENLDRAGRTNVYGGLLTVPPDFSSETGEYDLVIHFHGNTPVVEESCWTAPLNAAVLVFNLGIGSGPYEDRFMHPAVLTEVRRRVAAALEKRGLERPRERRLALSAWSAGYGAVVRILESAPAARDVDAVLLLDGMHASYGPNRKVDSRRIGPFVRFAERAVAGETLMVITHSDIEPGTYASVKATTNALLEAVGVGRGSPGPAPVMPDLESVRASVSKSSQWPLRPKSEAKKGGLVVLHYGGDQRQDHMGHLLQMRATALPYLAERWRSAGQPDE